MNFQGKLIEPDHHKKGPNAGILNLPNLVLRHVFMNLEAPVVIRKMPHDHLHDVFQEQDVLESDPRDLYNLLRTCRKLYENYEDIVRGRQLFSRFYVNISKPPPQEPQLIQRIGNGKLQIFVVNSKRQISHELIVQKAFQDLEIIHPRSISFQQRIEDNDALVDMLSRQCLKWIGTFINWPCDSREQNNDDPVVNIMFNLRQNFLGITNFHQYISSTKVKTTVDEEGATRCGARSFWAMICHCKTNKFLVVQNARGTIWDHNFTCPRIAMVTSTYADARRTYEQALASGYFEVGVNQ